MERIKRAESKVDRMEKVCSSTLDRIEERLGLLEKSCSSINVLVRVIQKAIESSFAIAQVFSSTIIFELLMLLSGDCRTKAYRSLKMVSTYLYLSLCNR